MSKTLRGIVLGSALVLPLPGMTQDEPVEAPQADAPAMPDESAAAPIEQTDAIAPEAEAASSEPPLETIPVESTAEEAPSADAPTEKSASRLTEEIVVTAQKREENIQEVPIAISAYSPEILDAIGIESAQDLERATPGLTITNAAGFSVAYLRGVGTDAFLPGADASVPFYLDGVALLGSQGSSDTLGRVKRVEVLKGPQGTLFGRNATGGAISIITPDPGSEFGGDLKLEYGDKFDERNALLYLDLPIFDGLAASVSGFYNEHDNYYTNDYQDGTGPIIDIDSRGGRAKLRWDATDTLAITVTGAYAEASNNAGLSFENTRVAPVLSLVLQEDPKRDRHLSYDQLAGATTEATIYSGIVDWRLPWFTTKLILSDQEQEAPFVRSDFDKSDLPLISFTSLKQLSKQETVELQFLSNDDTPGSDRFEWVGGFYYLDSSGGFDPLQLNVAPNFLTTLLPIPAVAGLVGRLNGLLTGVGLPDLASGVSLNSHGVLTSESMSVYFQGTYKISEAFSLTLGGRYQEEDRDLENASLAVPTGNDGREIFLRRDEVPTLKAKQFSPKVALQWRTSELSQIYASWARGFKSPTYNTVNFFDTPEDVKEEKVDSYELGFKSDLFDANLRLNAAIFFIEQKELLTGFVALASGGVVTYDNAGDSEIKGAEAEFVWTPLPSFNPGLVLTGAVTVLDTEYTDYPDGRGFDEATGLAFGPGGLVPVLGPRDFTGNEIVRSPDLTYSVGINQAIQLGSGSIELGADIYHNSGFFFLPQNSDLYAREEYSLINARVSYFYDPWQVQFTLFGENVTDEEYNEVVFVDDLGRNEVLNSPRLYGVRMKVEF
ncbi:MAG: TonB-dependent receptor domain-containing protein [Panacagrimonas sp.]